ncbi:autophagy protein atg9 [Apophysomyces ossiformis]|uniref:Autophagy-related protein 9 n=1 Tax=Apophysomyces ossiformis TaxID=679940 RepID=A0A8H7BZR5_9FUNG|nr:autophagy protein atg9 [Apophysomyces ossiformis]
MASSRLLHSQSSDEDLSLNHVSSPPPRNRPHGSAAGSTPRPLFLRHAYRPLSHTDHPQEDHEGTDESDLEAPASLMIEQPQPPPVTGLARRVRINQEQQAPSTIDNMSKFDRSLWRWANVDDMDDFFQRVYAYYKGKGIFCILLARFLNLLLSVTTTLFLTIFIAWWAWQVIRFVVDITVLRQMHDFYKYLLNIPDTISWQEVLERIISIREANPTAGTNVLRINEHDVANRIMRHENYLIALFNKDILDITIPLPYLRNKHIFTRDLEWNLSFCVLSYVFDRRGQEYHKNPSEIGSRAYSTFAKWKFREFNELPHDFQARISLSYAPANKYIDQFPKEKTALLARFVAFVTGSFAGVLALLSLYDSEALVNLQITPNGTVLFYLGLFGTAFAVSRGMIPDEHLVFEPEALLKEVVEHTHYLPYEWRGKLHTDEVRAQFCQLFDYKISLFMQELLSVIFTPLVLWFSLPKSAEQIVDFFREFTVHVDGLGYVCSFAQFDFVRHGNIKYGAPGEVDDEYYLSKEGKMEKSFLNFKANNPNWQPDDVAGSVYLTRLEEFQHRRKKRTAVEEEEEEDHRSIEEEGSEREDHTPAFQRSYFTPRPMTAPTIERSQPGSPMQLNQYGVPGMRGSYELDDSFERPSFRPTVEEAENHEDDEEERGGRPRMIGLLNQFYDLNNNPPM